MLSQHLTLDILNHAGGDLYARTGEGESRAVLFGITSGGDRDWNTVYVNINNPVVTARIVKPDGTFTITTAELISGPGELQEFRFYIPEAATQVSGIGSYDIRIQEDGEENIVYSAQGRFICDDNMLTDEMIESVAEVNGLIFPDDFLTTESGAATIDDTETALDSTWSSQKIANEIAGVIDDNSTSTGTTWSSDKIADEFAAIIDDDVESTGSTWSSDKIVDELGSIETLDVYSTTEKVVGEWIDGKTIYEKTVANEMALSTSWTNYVDASNMETIVSVEERCARDNEDVPAAFSYNEVASWIHRDGYIKVCITSGSGWKIKSLTIRYTKAS